MLGSSNRDNHHVHTALIDLDEWGLQANAKCYKHYSDAQAHVCNKMQLLEAKEAFYQEELANIVHRMEATRVMDKLGHLLATEEGEQVGRRMADRKRFKHGQGRPF